MDILSPDDGTPVVSPFQSLQEDGGKECGDTPKEKCGVIGVYKPGCAVRLAFFGLYALQHRGQEGAGIASSRIRGGSFSCKRGMGLVPKIFSEETIRELESDFAVGHTRYSTFGGSELINAQPFVIDTLHGPLALVHNGQITTVGSLRRKLQEKGVGMFTGSDSEVMAQMLARPLEWETTDSPPDWVNRIKCIMRQTKGAYSVCLMTKTGIVAFRDPLGLRPLCLGSLPAANGNEQKGFVVASETCALGTLGANFLREIAPGEIITITNGQVRRTLFEDDPIPKSPAFCIFEYVYFARPDSYFNSRLVHEVRQRLGRMLAQDYPCPQGDFVMGVPDSSTAAAIGFALESGIPYNEGLTKNRYIARTFIQPDNASRQKTIQLKYNTLISNLTGKHVVLVDDSIVRGNTLRHLISLLKTSNPKSLHVRISSSPIRHPCFMGINMSTYEELIANRKTVEEIRVHLGVDSLGFLSLEKMKLAVAGATVSDLRKDEEPCPSSSPSPSSSSSSSPSSSCSSSSSPSSCEGEDSYCTACFSGEYPLDIEDMATNTYQEKRKEAIAHSKTPLFAEGSVKPSSGASPLHYVSSSPSPSSEQEKTNKPSSSTQVTSPKAKRPRLNL